MRELIRRLEANRAMTFIWLAGATGVLLIIAVVGAMTVKSDKTSNVSAGTTRTTIGDSTASTVAGETTTTAAPTPGAAGPATTAKAAVKKASGATATPGHQTVVTLPSTAGATRIGVANDTIKYGLHAPKTLQGVPWGLADDALKGVRIYLNQVNQQKVNGRTITEYFADDRYDTGGGAAAGDTLINDNKVFFAEGTLGVDQIAQVAKKARASQPAPTPYMAAGGAESKFKDIGMYQVAGSYDTHLVALAHFLDKEFEKSNCAPSSCPLNLSVSPYGHLDGDHNGKMKVGISALNSEYIVPAVDSLKAAIQSSKHLELGAIVTVEKPEGGAQTTYTNQVLQLRGADVVIPAQDPLSTSNEVSTCAKTCNFLWTFSNFAHDGDVDLALMKGEWTGFRGLSSGCYYLEYNSPRAPRCAKLTQAHDIWVNGTDPAVDNGGGDKGDGSKQTEATWRSNGQSGAAGYQVVHFWLGALKQAGPDLTREKFVAALNAYSGYDDLVTLPLTFAGSPNKAHGVDGFAVYQAGPPDGSKPKGVGFNQLSDGLSGF
jgi:hypothetical protein